MVMSMDFMAVYREVKSSNQIFTVIQRSLIGKIAFVESQLWHYSVWHVFDLACDVDEEASVPNAVCAWPNYLWWIKYRFK